MLTLNSSGTQSQRKILNSASERRPTTGRSKNFYRMMTDVRLFTWMARVSMPAASISSRYTIAIPPTTRLIKIDLNLGICIFGASVLCQWRGFVRSYLAGMRHYGEAKLGEDSLWGFVYRVCILVSTWMVL